MFHNCSKEKAELVEDLSKKALEREKQSLNKLSEIKDQELKASTENWKSKLANLLDEVYFIVNLVFEENIELEHSIYLKMSLYIFLYANLY